MCDFLKTLNTPGTTQSPAFIYGSSGENGSSPSSPQGKKQNRKKKTKLFLGLMELQSNWVQNPFIKCIKFPYKEIQKLKHIKTLVKE